MANYSYAPDSSAPVSTSLFTASSGSVQLKQSPLGVLTTESPSIAKATSQTCGWMTASGDPGITSWGSGTYTVTLAVTAGNSSLSVTKVEILRLDSTGTTLKGTIGSATFSTSLSAAGTKTFTVSGSAQSPLSTDILAVRFTVANSAAHASSSFSYQGGSGTASVLATPIAIVGGPTGSSGSTSVIIATSAAQHIRSTALATITPSTSGSDSPITIGPFGASGAASVPLQALGLNDIRAAQFAAAIATAKGGAKILSGARVDAVPVASGSDALLRVGPFVSNGSANAEPVVSAFGRVIIAASGLVMETASARGVGSISTAASAGISPVASGSSTQVTAGLTAMSGAFAMVILASGASLVCARGQAVLSPSALDGTFCSSHADTMNVPSLGYYHLFAPGDSSTTKDACYFCNAIMEIHAP